MSLGGIGDAVGYRLYHQIGRARSHFQESRDVPVDILESEESFLLVFNAPGVTAADADVRFHDGSVHVELERYREYREGYRMRFPGRGMTLTAEVSLPEHAIVEPESAVARVTDRGTVQVELPTAVAEAEDTGTEAAADD